MIREAMKRYLPFFFRKLNANFPFTLENSLKLLKRIVVEELKQTEEMLFKKMLHILLHEKLFTYDCQYAEEYAETSRKTCTNHLYNYLYEFRKENPVSDIAKKVVHRQTEHFDNITVELKRAIREKEITQSDTLIPNIRLELRQYDIIFPCSIESIYDAEYVLNANVAKWRAILELFTRAMQMGGSKEMLSEHSEKIYNFIKTWRDKWHAATYLHTEFADKFKQFCNLWVTLNQA